MEGGGERRLKKEEMTGGKKRKEIYEAFEKIYPVLQEYKKGAGIVMAPPMIANDGRDAQEASAEPAK